MKKTDFIGVLGPEPRLHAFGQHRKAFEELSVRMQRNESLVGARLDPTMLERLWCWNRAYCKFDEHGKIIAFAGFWCSADVRWVELGSLYSDPECSRETENEIAVEMVTYILHNVVPGNLNLFTICKPAHGAFLQRFDSGWKSAGREWDNDMSWSRIIKSTGFPSQALKNCVRPHSHGEELFYLIRGEVAYHSNSFCPSSGFGRGGWV